MATVGSFTGFAQKPDLAGATQRGQALQLQAAQAAAQLQMQHAQLRQQRELAQMESALRQQQLERDANFRSQALKIDGEYKQQMMGLKERQIEMQEAQVAAQAQQAAMQMQAQQALQQEIAQIQSTPGLSDEEIDRKTSLAYFRHGNIPSGASGLMRAGQQARTEAQAKNIQPRAMQLEVDGKIVNLVTNPQTGHFQIIKEDDPEGLDPILVRGVRQEQFKSIQRELEDVKQVLRAQERPYRSALEATPRRRSSYEAGVIEAYEELQSEMEALEQRLETMTREILSGGGQQQQSAPARLRFNPQTGEFETR